MSCYPKCPVPSFLLPKKQKRQTMDCIEKCDAPNCTSCELYAIAPPQELCMNPELGNLLRSHACQEQHIKRIIAMQQDQDQCNLQKRFFKIPEIPFLCSPERPAEFINHGFTTHACFPHNIRKNPCKQRAAWRKKVKSWIKELSQHYNAKVADPNQQPIEDYLRLNLSNLCVSCKANEEQTRIEQAKKCGISPEEKKPGCMMVAMQCGKCGKKQKENKTLKQFC